MRFQLFSLSAVAAFSSLASAAAVLGPRQEDGIRLTTCANVATRKELRQLTYNEKTQWAESVKCLMNKASALVPGTSRWDDFSRVHASLNDQIHLVASFLPWHRYFVHLYENALRDECGYAGYAPYWDWTLDSPNPAAAPVWDADTGVGGNGSNERVQGDKPCVNDGPFADYEPSYDGSVEAPSPHCLSRSFNDGSGDQGPMSGNMFSAWAVSQAFAHGDYNSFRSALELGPHGAVHNSISGDMAVATSPNDPVFFLHHGQIDRLWTLWQEADLASRAMAFGGDRDQSAGDGRSVAQATLDDIMPLNGLAGDVPVRAVMSTTSGGFCYTY